MLILVINPGSTSTKIAVYDDEKPILLRTINHSAEELSQFDDVLEQQSFRKQVLLNELQQAHLPMNFDAVIGRGGLVKPLEGGVYEINEQMVIDTHSGIAMHNHACNLGCLIAYEIALEISGCRAFIADPGVVDELNDYARISGSPMMNRICIWHALNQRAIAQRYAAEIGRRYEDLNLIVCHMGGGISIAAHEHGKAVDANNALDGEGPFSPERAGSLPAADLIRLCFSGKYTEKQLLKRIAGKAGLNAHLGTNDVKEIISHTSRHDEYTAAAPIRWGEGKIDAEPSCCERRRHCMRNCVCPPGLGRARFYSVRHRSVYEDCRRRSLPTRRRSSSSYCCRYRGNWLRVDPIVS